MRLPPARVDQIFALIAEGTVLSKETAAELQGHVQSSEEMIHGLMDTAEDQSKKIREMNRVQEVSDKVIDSLQEELKKERAKHGSPTCNTD